MNNIDNIKKAIYEVQKSRSRFQLEKFVIGQHKTPEMQYYQTCLELQDLFNNYELTKLELEKQTIKLKRLNSSKDELDKIKAKKLELSIKQTLVVMHGAEREIADLIDIFNSFEKNYTREEIEQAQPDYWQKRLTGNATAMLMGGSGINPSHIEALEQAGFLDEYIESQQIKEKELENEIRNLET